MNKDLRQVDVLVWIRKREIDAACRWEDCVFWLQVGAGALAFIGLSVPENAITQSLSLLSFILAIGTLWASYESRKHRLTGEKARRAVLLVEGIGLRLPDEDIKRFTAAAVTNPADFADDGGPPDYATVLQPGVAKVAEMVEESAFWSRDLYRASARRVGCFLTVAVLCSVAGFLLSLRLLSTTNNIVQLKVFSAMASSIVSIEFFTRYWLYRMGVADMDDIHGRLGRLRAEKFPANDFWLVVLDYNSAVEGAPLISPKIYEQNEKRLEELWRTRFR